PPWLAAIIDLGLIGVFALHHSVAARSGFKARLARILPPAAERSTYVLIASLLLLILIWHWRPIDGLLWDLQAPLPRGVLVAVYLAGWMLVLASTFQISHGDLFGISQVLRHWRERPAPEARFRQPPMYQVVRHPMHAGMLVVCWATPTMSTGHLLFAAAMTAYVLVGIRLEERDLLGLFGDAYRRYRMATPKLLPLPRRPDRAAPRAGDRHSR
ncbi:MAG TPA: NnrU family protein, partial [Arenicellales bacterium]|nr:NnrU family protein [Arenicellales bacterium]